MPPCRSTRAVLAVAVALAVLLAFGLAGCGGDGGDQVTGKARQSLSDIAKEAARLDDEAKRLREQLAARVKETLQKIEKVIPAAGPSRRPPRQGARTMEEFLTAVLEDVDGYWTATLQRAGLPKPEVRHVWVEPGQTVTTGCGAQAGDDAAFYCPADDTIYIAVRFATAILRGVARNLPGERFGQGHAVGDMGVAYVVAHEYAHNLQYDLGWFQSFQTLSVTPFELQADCMAGSWANSAYRRGELDRGDVLEAISTAAAVGDFDLLSPQHHGTPQERVQAWLAGYRSGDPGVCQEYLPV